MSEELKPCPFCGGEATTTKKGPIRNQWWEVVCVSGECDTASITGGTEKAAIAAWNTRADLLPVVKPLVAGAYEAAASELAKAAQAEAEINNPRDAELLWHIEKRIRALTPADAQAALDAAISKAVNAKLDEVAGVELSFPKYQSVEYQAGWESAVVEMADAILAMKEPE